MNSTDPRISLFRKVIAVPKAEIDRREKGIGRRRTQSQSGRSAHGEQRALTDPAICPLHKRQVRRSRAVSAKLRAAGSRGSLGMKDLGGKPLKPPISDHSPDIGWTSKNRKRSARVDALT
jgi:hypothetical protein